MANIAASGVSHRLVAAHPMRDSLLDKTIADKVRSYNVRALWIGRYVRLKKGS